MESTTLHRAGTRSSVQAVALIIIGTVIFWPGLNGWFVFDDHVNLVMSSHWKVTSLDWREWLNAIQGDISGPFGRPLAMASFAANHYFTGLNPYWLKFGNLLVHLTNGILVWTLCRRIFRLLPGDRTLSIYAPFIVAALWTFHPIHASSVLYIVQRMEIGAATGILLALLCYVIGRDRQISGLRGWPWLIAGLIGMLIGLGFKETALLTPLFALAIELTVLRFNHQRAATSRQLKFAWIATVLVGVSLYLFLIVSQIKNWPVGLRDFGPAERLLTQLPVLLMYLQQVTLPLPDSMKFFYDNFPVSRGIFQPYWTLISALLLLAITSIAVASYRSLPLVTLGVAWFFIGHALTSNLWPLELAFEHRNYLASLGIVIALAQPITLLFQRASRSAVVTVLIMLVAFVAALSNLQARTWGNPMLLAWTLENRNPESPRASYELGSQLLIAANDDPSSPFWSMAFNQFSRGIYSTNPSPLSLQGLFLMHGRIGIEPSESHWDLLRDALTAKEFAGERPGALYALAACQIGGNCKFDINQMLRTYLALLEKNPNNPLIFTMYANYAWNVLEDPELAIRLQREALRLDPSSTETASTLTSLLLASPTHARFSRGPYYLVENHVDNLSETFEEGVEHLQRSSEAATDQEPQPNEPEH